MANEVVARYQELKALFFAYEPATAAGGVA